MESNDVGGIFVGWGMSITSKRAKERQKRTPDELVMVKTVKRKKTEIPGAGHPGVGPDFRDLMSRNLRKNALQEPDVRANGRISGMAGCPGVGPDVRAPNPRMNSRNSILGAEIDDFGGKIGEI